MVVKWLWAVNGSGLGGTVSWLGIGNYDDDQDRCTRVRIMASVCGLSEMCMNIYENVIHNITSSIMRHRVNQMEKPLINKHIRTHSCGVCLDECVWVSMTPAWPMNGANKCVLMESSGIRSDEAPGKPGQVLNSLCGHNKNHNMCV